MGNQEVLNEAIFNNYKRLYPNLQGFTYNALDNSLVYNGDRIILNGPTFPDINGAFFRMQPDDIFSFLKNGFYNITDDFTRIIVTEEFIARFNAQYLIYAHNKDLLDELSISNISIRAFTRDLLIKYKIINQSKANIQPTNLDNTPNSNSNTQSETLSQEMTLTRNKPGVRINYNDFEQMEKDYIADNNKIGIAGFASILLIVTVTIITGIFLAYMITK